MKLTPFTVFAFSALSQLSPGFAGASDAGSLLNTPQNEARIDALACTQSTASWTLVQKLREKFPKLGEAMQSALITEWLVAVGDEVSFGSPLVTVETDKVTTEIEAPAGGRLRRIADEGVTYQVGDPVAELLEP